MLLRGSPLLRCWTAVRMVRLRFLQAPPSRARGRAVLLTCCAADMLTFFLLMLFFMQTPFWRWDADEDKDMRKVLEAVLASEPHPRDFIIKRVFFKRAIEKLRSVAEWARLRGTISLERSLLRTLVDTGRIKGKYKKNAHTRNVSGKVFNVFLGIRLSTTPACHSFSRASRIAAAACAAAADEDTVEE